MKEQKKCTNNLKSNKEIRRTESLIENLEMEVRIYKKEKKRLHMIDSQQKKYHYEKHLAYVLAKQ